ncbi:MAG: NAD(P)/FAD-dependent oxidoreductase, partial [Candidatus Nanohaloarchaea archaeon]
FYPSLHRVLQGTPMAAVRIDYDAVFAGRDITHVQDRVTGMDPDTHQIQLENGALSYETCVVAVGSETSYGSIDGEGNVHDLRFRDDTEAVTARVRDRSLDQVVVIGGGATGVEATASLYEASDQLDDFGITLLEGADRLLPRFTAAVGTAVDTAYRDRGIDVRTGAFVDRIGEDCVVLQDGTEIDTDLTVWAGGVAPRPVTADLGLDHTDDGIPVDDYMRAADDVYVVGDAATYEGKVNRAFYAIMEAKTAAGNITRSRAGKPLNEHEVGWDPNLLHLGPWNALFELNGHIWCGRVPALMRRIGVEQRYLWTRRHLL